ncbi:MAG: transcription elongation factor GreA [Patescibacteria group bacterium]
MTNQDSEYFSEEGLKKLKDDIETLKTKTRREIADRLEYAKSLGDLSENSEYQEAKEAQVLNETQIVELEDALRRAVVVKKSNGKDYIDIGSRVVLERTDQPGTKLEFFVVGSNESSPGENKISNESPLGGALWKRKKNEVVSVPTPKGKVEYKILEIF